MIQYVTAQEAADILHISRSRLYHIKDRLTHRKGNTPQSQILFRKDTLVDDYMNK